MRDYRIENNGPLLDFRLAYLRAIARSWHDTAYREELLMQRDIQPMLNRDFGLKSVWPLLDVAIHRIDDPGQRTVWKSHLTGGWTGLNDAFGIVMPQRPAANASEALAAYYQFFPDFMGPVGVFAEQQAHSPVPSSAVTGLSALDEVGSLGGGPESMLAFGGVVLRAIAMAWESEEFLRELTRPDQSDATPVLSQWLGYNNPYNFFVRFAVNPDFVWDVERGAWNLKNADGSTIKNSVVLNYPVAPAAEASWPIALTSYNHTGSAYPFTC
jgi:ribosomally synthesized peptide (two-chain TOMM family)